MKRCGLEHTLGMHASCGFSACVFWRLPDSESGVDTPMCVLEQYDLVKGNPNRITRWLFEYKVSRKRVLIRKMVHGYQVAQEATTEHEILRLASG